MANPTNLMNLDGSRSMNFRHLFIRNYHFVLKSIKNSSYNAGAVCYNINMIKYLVALLVLVAAGAGLYWFGTFARTEPEGPVGASDYKSATFLIEGEEVTLVNGKAESDPPAGGAPGSASKTITQYFGNEAKGDINDDGIPDLAFLLTQTRGGSGTFYYVVVALQTPAGGYTGTNAILLGDRIAPQPIEIRHTIVIANYADRKPGEPMTTQPSVGTSKYTYFDQGSLIDLPTIGPIVIRGTVVCLPYRDTLEIHTMECAFGLKDEKGRYFALKDADPTYKNVSGAPMNELAEVTGEFKLQLGSKYQDIGIIEVTKITKVGE